MRSSILRNIALVAVAATLGAGCTLQESDTTEKR